MVYQRKKFITLSTRVLILTVGNGKTKGRCTYDVHFKGGAEEGVQGKNEMLLDVVGWDVNECSGRPIFIFFIKDNCLNCIVCGLNRTVERVVNLNLT